MTESTMPRVEGNLLGGKMMKAIQSEGQIYIHEPDVRDAVNAALATNAKRNDRITELESQVANYQQLFHEYVEDAARLDWLGDTTARAMLGDADAGDAMNRFSAAYGAALRAGEIPAAQAAGAFRAAIDEERK